MAGTCRLNNVEPEKWLHYVIEHIQKWPAGRVRDLLFRIPRTFFLLKILSLLFFTGGV
ncbi:transposase domain-containing protein [Salmonella enterica subsp. enterica serovar Braenderup]